MDQHPGLKTVLLDMDGVLWHGSEPVLNIQLLFEHIQDLELQALCVTNNSTRTIDYHLEKLSQFGVSMDPSRIITSAEATAAYLERELPPESPVFMIGEEGLESALRDRGFRILDEDAGSNALAVVVGLDREFNYQDLDLAVRFIHRGALFVGTNPDLTIPTPTGQAPGAGTIIEGIKVSSGKKPYIIGKPFSALYSLALERAHSLPIETLMIGDRLETDILGAQEIGMQTAVVMTGIATRDQAEIWDPSPDIIADDALQVIDLIRNTHG